LAREEREMKHKSRALPSILACGGFLLAGARITAGAPQNSTDKFKNLEFREIGPAVMGGRIDDFAVVESDPNIVYVGTASGGVWKTTNNGTTWEPVFDKENVSTIGDVAIAPSDPSVVWVGTGEPNNRQSSSWGDGIYKSLDAGKTWKKMMGLEATHHIARIVIHPKNPDVVYVAAQGHLWGANPERGVYKTGDGGKSWSQVLKINDDTGVTDIAIDPASPDILYAAAYERRRTPFGFNGGGPGSAIYKTTDGGATWKKLENGIPEGDKGRIGLALARSKPDVLVATIEHATAGGTYRTEDAGATWKKMSSTNPRPMYYSKPTIDPNNDRRIWLPGTYILKSENGGATFEEELTSPTYDVGLKTDHHVIRVDPSNSSHIYVVGDGGLHESFDMGKTYIRVNNIPVAQVYRIAADNREPYYIYAGLQD